MYIDFFFVFCVYSIFLEELYDIFENLIPRSTMVILSYVCSNKLSGVYECEPIIMHSGCCQKKKKKKLK